MGKITEDEIVESKPAKAPEAPATAPAATGENKTATPDETKE